MENKPMAVSYSALSDFQQCPRKFHSTRILKKFPFVETEATRFGKRVHSNLENYIKAGTPMDEDISHLQQVGEAIRKKAGRIYTEVRLASDWNLNSTGYFDPDVWMRAQADVLIVNNEEGELIDWKTGSDKYPDTFQLDIAASLAFARFPSLQTVIGKLVFLKGGSITQERYYREDVQGMWSEIQRRGAAIEQARALNQWPEKQGPLCPWCPDTECQFWRPQPEK